MKLQDETVTSNVKSFYSEILNLSVTPSVAQAVAQAS